MIKVRRGQVGKSSGLDVTVRSGQGMASLFAPDAHDVWMRKKGLMEWSEFATRYRVKLMLLPPHAWEWLGKQSVDGRLTLLCYCPPDKPECHTQLLLERLIHGSPETYSVV